MLELIGKNAVPYLTAEDNDAVGYAVMSDKISGERWLNVKDAMVSRPKTTTLLDSLVLEDDPQYNKFGDGKIYNSSSMILHARYATCGTGIENAHPFISEDGKTALIHNGVISKRGLEFKTSTCDSEGILNEYVKQDVSNNPDNIQKVVNKLNGAFACAVLTEDNSGRKYMDIFRNNEYPTLYMCNVEGFKMIATRPDLIENSCRPLGLKLESMMKVQDNSFIRLDAVTGEILYSRFVEKERARTAAKSKKKGKKK